MQNELELLAKRNYLTIHLNASSNEFIEVETQAGEIFHERFLGFIDTSDPKPDLLVTCRGWRDCFADNYTYTEIDEFAAGIQTPQGIKIILTNKKPLFIRKHAVGND
mgnify:CR=1 FL=1